MSLLHSYQVPDKYYLQKVDKLLPDGARSAPRHPELFGSASDEFWLWLLTQGVRIDPRLRELLPQMPGESTQLQANGLCGDEAMQDGLLIYRLVKTIFEGLAGDLKSCRAILDFGCGWGRITRFFLRDVDPANVWGVDHYDKAIAICQQTNPWQNFRQIRPFPPMDFPDSTFDLIFAYSVFSHLSEAAQREWVVEFARVLRPGGVLIATTWDRELIVRCAELRAQPDLPSFQTHLPTMFSDTERWLAAYDSGEFCFDSSPESYGDVASYLGETCIPRQYVENHWSRCLDVVDFIDDRTVCPQNLIVATGRHHTSSAGVLARSRRQEQPT